MRGVRVVRLQSPSGQGESVFNSLCTAANQVIAEGSGIGWLTPFDRPVVDLGQYFRSVMDSQHHELYVATRGDVGVGSIQLVHNLYNPRAEAAKHRGELQCFFVNPDARGHGVGSSLLAFSEQRARQLSIDVLTLDVRSSQKSAIALYEQCGYRRWGTMPLYAQNREGVMHEGYFYIKDLRSRGEMDRFDMFPRTAVSSPFTRSGCDLVPLASSPQYPPEHVAPSSHSPATGSSGGHAVAQNASRETIIMLHGFPDTTDSFSGMKAYFEQLGFDVFVPSLPGYGPNLVPDSIPSDPSTFQLHALASSLRHFIKNDLGLTTAVHLIGHDWGSVIAQQCALTYPTLLKSLVLLSIPFNFLQNALRSLPSQLIKSSYMLPFMLPHPLAEWPLVRRGGFRRLVCSWSPGLAADLRDRLVESAERNLSSRHTASAAVDYYRQNVGGGSCVLRSSILLGGGLVQLMLRVPPLRPLAALLVRSLESLPLVRNHPCYQLRAERLKSRPLSFSARRVLQVGGREDGCCDAGLFEMMEGVTRVVVVEGAGHWVHLEQPAVVHEAIRKHIAKCR